MASTTRIDELKKKFDENPRRYFAPLANEFRKAGEIDQAIMICEEFLPQQPGHMSGHIVYGQALYEAGRLPESRGVFETALGLDPENLIALRHLGDIASSQNDPAAAKGWYVRVLDADPRNEEIQSLIAGLDVDDAGLLDFDPMPDRPLAAPTGLGLNIDTASSPFDHEEAGDDSQPAVEDGHSWNEARATFDQPSTHDIDSRPLVDLSLADTAPAGVPIIPASPIVAAFPAGQVLDGFSLHEFDAAADREAEPPPAATAEGFEPTEFAPPTEPVPLEELDASLDSGVPSFASPEHQIEPLDGLEGSGGQPHAREASRADHLSDLEPLDLEGGLIPLAAVDAIPAELRAPSFDAPPPADDLLDFDLATPTEATEHVRLMDDADGDGDELNPAPGVAVEYEPTELPPEVIAAEAELIAAGETPEPPAVDDEWPEVAARPPFVTETMAELYLAQGFREQALAVYSDLLAASPHDERLAGIVASLAPARTADDGGPNVRDFFARIASRRPGMVTAALQPPADDDFAPADDLLNSPEVASEPAEIYSAAPEPEALFAEEVIPAPVTVTPSASVDMPTAIERAAATQQSDGSIDALFGNRSIGTSEDSAAAALAQAFGGGTDVGAAPPIPGRPAHAASGELSLDSVFRDGPARPTRSSQSFSFDQFFAGAEDRAARLSPPRGMAVPAETRETPAERGADDIEQFNAWLQGLKQR